MLFPKDARKNCCDCLNRTAQRTKGFCIQKQQGKYVKIDSDSPSVVILFRDPTIEKNRNVEYVLDVNNGLNEEVSSKLFDPYSKHLLQHFPEREIIFLDNLVRCRLPFRREELKQNFSTLSEPYAQCCWGVSKLFFNKNLSIKCLILSSVDVLVWLEKKRLLHYQSNEIKQYFEGKKKHINSTTMLGERFKISGCQSPVFFFPHPVTLKWSYKKDYELKKDNLEKLKHGSRKILETLK